MTETNTTKSSSAWIIWIIIIVVIGFIIYKAQDGVKYNAIETMNVIKNNVALDAEQQYDIAKRYGDKIEIYVHASMVAAAYLQAKDEVNYERWKAIEKEDAKKAGLPQY